MKILAYISYGICKTIQWVSQKLIHYIGAVPLTYCDACGRFFPKTKLSTTPLIGRSNRITQCCSGEMGQNWGKRTNSRVRYQL